MMGGGGHGRAMARGPMGPGMGVPPARSKDFRGTLRKLLARLRPDRWRLAAAVALGVVSVGFIVTGPKILGNATNVLFNGIVRQRLPAGMTKAQAIAILRAHGQGQLADMLSGMNVTPGAGTDLTRLGQWLGLAALVYLLGAAFTWGQGYLMAGITQRAITGCGGRSRRSSRGCRCATSTATRTATSSAGSPMTSTTSPPPCSRASACSSPRR